jgi:hypothetical protein
MSRSPFVSHRRTSLLSTYGPVRALPNYVEPTPLTQFKLAQLRASRFDGDQAEVNLIAINVERREHSQTARHDDDEESHHADRGR